LLGDRSKPYEDYNKFGSDIRKSGNDTSTLHASSVGGCNGGSARFKLQNLPSLELKHLHGVNGMSLASLQGCNKLWDRDGRCPPLPFSDGVTVYGVTEIW